MTEMNIVEAINSTLAAEMEREERIILLGQDIGRVGGVFRVTEGLFERFGAARVVDMPLAEGAIIGSSVGLAVSGLISILRAAVPRLRIAGLPSDRGPGCADAFSLAGALSDVDGDQGAVRRRGTNSRRRIRTRTKRVTRTCLD